MSNKTFDSSRRRLFRQGAIIASGAALGGLMLKSTAEAQAGTVPKATAKYQDKPHGTQKCSGCTLYIPGKSASASGTCKIVEGSISPEGWCMYFSPKS